MKTFSDIGIKPELVASLKRINFVNPTEVQETVIPLVLEQKDLVVRAKTGSGKTGAFLVPILDMINRQEGLSAIVIAPTRELALQVTGVAEKICHNLGIRIVTVYGGSSISAQVSTLKRGVNIVIGTPGRILDLMKRRALNLNGIRFLVLDEADTMLDMGFIDDIELIISNMPRERQTLLFSATMPKRIFDIARKHMKEDREKITIGEEEDLTVSTISHTFAIAPYQTKFHTLLAYIDKYAPKKAIIFTNTKHDASRVYTMLSQQGFNAILMHGGLTQSKRNVSLDAFKRGARFLIATNVAARGLDIPEISDIINFDAPDAPNVYIHRVGRSARMGKDGRAFTIITASQHRLMDSIKYAANIEIKKIILEVEKFKDIKVMERSHRDRGFEGTSPRGRFQRHGGGQRYGGGSRYGGERREGGERSQYGPNRFGSGSSRHSGGFRKRFNRH